jgi:hypothetical protein
MSIINYMDDQPVTPELETQVPPPQPIPQVDSDKETKARMVALGIVAVIILGLLITGAVLLLQGQASRTAQIRDVFIIFMALESLVIGVALVILMVQLAILINLLQNEIRPILNSTNETVNTLRGTVTFLSDNLAEPVIKLNEYLAGLRRLVDIFRPGKK